MNKFKLISAGFGLALVLGTVGVLAQAGRPAAPAPANLNYPMPNGFISTPGYGFETTGQIPSKYTPQEAAAAAVVLKWIDTINAHDLAAHMALIDDNIIARPDPQRILSHGAQAYCSSFGFVRGAGVYRLDEMYIVGGPKDVMVLLKRIDLNGAAGTGIYGGYPVQLADLLRVKNGKITEWYDVPINKAGALESATAGSRGPGGANVIDACKPFSAGSK
jgi:hypothetical protein